MQTLYSSPRGLVIEKQALDTKIKRAHTGEKQATRRRRLETGARTNAGNVLELVVAGIGAVAQQRVERGEHGLSLRRGREAQPV